MTTTTDLGGPTTTRASGLPDLGLLVLRFAVGASMLQSGLPKALDLDETAANLESSEWRLSTVAAYMLSGAEVLGGLGLLLGLLTPLAACAVIAVMMDAWAVNVAGTAFWSDPFNIPFLLAFAATTVLLTGAGAHSIDAKAFGRARWPGAVTVAFFVVAVVAAIATWILLKGTNPIHFTAPTP